MRRLLPVAVLVLVAACSGSFTHAAPAPTHATATRTPLVKPKPKPSFAVTTAVGAFTFVSVDGNLGCDIEPAYARCDPAHHSWDVPPQPSDCASGWGHGIE